MFFFKWPAKFFFFLFKVEDIKILDTFLQNHLKKNVLIIIIYVLIIISDNNQAKLFCFLLVFSFGRFSIKKIFQNFGRLYLDQM